MGVPNVRKLLRKRMEVPVWVHIVSHGTPEELRTFIRANPGFDWDRTAFDGYTAFWYVWRYRAFIVGTLDILHNLGGAKFEAKCCADTTPMDIAAYQGDGPLAAILLRYGVRVTKAKQLCQTADVCETLLEHCTTLTKDVVNAALINVRNKPDYMYGLYNPYWVSARNALLRWLVSYDKRRDASVCVAWTLSQLTGTQWPDMSEGVARRLMETRVRDW